MEHSWCPHPSLVGIGRFVKDLIPLCCLERGVGEDLVPRQGGLGPLGRSLRLREVSLTRGSRSCSDYGGHSPAHHTSTGTPEVVFPITLFLPGRDETALCFKEHPDPISKR